VINAGREDRAGQHNTRKGVDGHMGFFRVIGGLLVALLVVGLGAAIYQPGFNVGAAGAAGVAGGAVPVVVGPGYGYGWGWGWGFGGGLFHLLGFIFFVFIFFAILRAIFGGHRRGWGRGWGPGGYGDHPGHGDHPGQQFGPWEDRARQVHDEWHRRQDAPGAAGPTTPTGPTGPSTPSGDSGSGNTPAGGNPA
jgi:hypothetical protein